MNSITTLEELKGRILTLETRRDFAEMELKRQFAITYEAMKPAALIKNAVKELATAPNFKGDLITALVSLGAGYLSKRLAIGSSHNPIKMLLGNLLQVGVTKTVANNSDTIKSTASRFIRNILSNGKSQSE
jgi:hypothetical protein